MDYDENDIKKSLKEAEKKAGKVLVLGIKSGDLFIPRKENEPSDEFIDRVFDEIDRNEQREIIEGILS